MTEATRKFVSEDCKRSCVDPDSFVLLKDQKILITGGTGFMGKWITEMVLYLNSFSNLNIELYLLGRDAQRFKNEVPHLFESQFVNLIEQDARNIHDLPDDINYIINAVGSPDNREHVSEPLKTVETFYKGTLSLFDNATRLPNLKRIVHISSHQVYGKNESSTLINENFLGQIEPNTINHLYAESKRISETLCSVYRNNFRLPISIIRPFAFIGPYQDLEKPWAINNFIRDAILGGPIRILGNGSTIRSYLYGSDMAYWILKSLIDGQAGEVYNLGSTDGISLDELAMKIKNAIGSNIEILSKSSKEKYASLSKLVPDTSKTIKNLNVMGTIKLDDAINRTIIWNQLNKN